jgi:hypothetical protein
VSLPQSPKDRKDHHATKKFWCASAKDKEQLCAAIAKVWCKKKEIEMIGTFFLTKWSFVNALDNMQVIA